MITSIRKISQFAIAIAIIVAFSLASISSAAGAAALVSLFQFTPSSEFAVIPGNPATIVEKSSFAESSVLFVVGVGLIAVALWGRKKYQR